MSKILRLHQDHALTEMSKAIKGIINYPTGTGKSLIQSRSIIENIKLDNTHKVYVILSPRILLARQLLDDIKTDLIENNIDAHYLTVNSGGTGKDKSKAWYELAIKANTNYIHRDILATTKKQVIIDEYNKSIREKVPFIISSTYDSAIRIKQAGIPIEVYHCDEAHYLVSEEFRDIVDYPSNKKYFYTATMKVTTSTDGLGMNNYDRFGDIIVQESPLNMINKGEILRPRMHFVDLSEHSNFDNEVDGKVIVEAFKEHSALVQSHSYGLGAKMLVTAKSSDDLEAIVNHEEILRMQEVSLNLTIFDITAKYEPRINGVIVKRETFLETLKNLKDEDNAIILHINILTEGIDVTGITGILPMSNLKKSKFLQTLGRATRLNTEDRIKLYNEVLNPKDVSRFIKPYAWVIVPVYGDFGDDLKEHLYDMIEELRSFGFNPAEDCYIKPKNGKAVPKEIDLTTEPNKSSSDLSLINFVGSILHEIENKEKADILEVDILDISHDSEEEVYTDMLDMLTA